MKPKQTRTPQQGIKALLHSIEKFGDFDGSRQREIEHLRKQLDISKKKATNVTN